MSKNNKNNAQNSLFENELTSFVKAQHKLVMLADKINLQTLIDNVES